MRYEAPVVDCICVTPLFFNCQRVLPLFFFFLDLINKLVLQLENQRKLCW